MIAVMYEWSVKVFVYKGKIYFHPESTDICRLIPYICKKKTLGYPLMATSHKFPRQNYRFFL